MSWANKEGHDIVAICGLIDDDTVERNFMRRIRKFSSLTLCYLKPYFQGNKVLKGR